MDTQLATQRQMDLEQEMLGLGQLRYNTKAETSGLAELPPGQALMQAAIVPMMEAIAAFKKPSRGGERHGASRRFFGMFDDSVLAFITIRRCLNAVGNDEPLQRVALNIVSQLSDQLEYEKYKAEAPAHLKVVERNLTTDHERVKRRVIMRAKRTIGIEDTQWDTVEQLHFGIKLIDLMIQSSGLVARAKRVAKGKEQVVLQATPETLVWIEERHAKCALLAPVYLPMVIKPRPWTDPFTGGFLHNAATMRHRLIKTRDKDTLFALAEQNMPEVYAAINALQDTPWLINKEVLAVAQELWRDGTGVAGLPKMTKDKAPSAPWNDDEEYNRLKHTDPAVIKSWKIKATRVHADWAHNLSNRISANSKLSLAQRFKDEPELYFCWTMDFRGRMYPIQPLVNPQADDLGKGLLKFAQGKRLGSVGWKWLQIHLANSFGVDKVSFADRLKWVTENHEQILEYAAFPLDTATLWGQADSPFVFLGTCMEYAKAVLSGNPESFVSHMPVGLDGSCNGLQHFSAALRDTVGGSATNLIPSKKPADIYAEVAKVVSLLVEADFSAGDEMAALWLNKVDRSICKRGVMTTPYGVTRQGMQEQLCGVLAEKGHGYLDTEDTYAAVRYLTPLLWEAIGQVVIAARDAMAWLQACASVAGAANVAMKWTTPVGLTVFQAYKVQDTTRVNTFMGSCCVRLSVNQDKDGNIIDKRAGRNGIAPNWVHSLDAAHMTATINRMTTKGVSSFAMVHDSYATHAANCDTMASTLREAFVGMYSEDVLARFLTELIAQLPAEAVSKLPPMPLKGDLSLDQIANSEYFFA